MNQTTSVNDQPVSSSFSPSGDVLIIPKSAYKPVKRCPHCNSIYITDVNCEACGRNLVYDPVGKPFDGKSFYGIKEKYVLNFSIFLKNYPNFENKKSENAKSYVRKIKKRLFDLLDYFNFREYFYDEDSLNERKYFFIECKMIIEELVAYGESTKTLQLYIENKSHGVLLEELVLYLHSFEKPESIQEVKKIKFSKKYFWTAAFYLSLVISAILYYPHN